MDLCERSAQRLGARVSWRWWEQDGFNLEGAKKGSETAADSYGEEKIGKEEGMTLGKTTGQE